MWKESYKIGVEHIDKQHEELFSKTHELLQIIQGEDAVARMQECINVILYLKGYAVDHFAVEEEYMLSTNYSNIKKHKLLHKVFVDTVLALEQKLRNANFSIAIAKEITGFLSTWLIYHVAGIDQTLTKRMQIAEDTDSAASSYINCFAESLKNVLNTMVGLTAGSIIFAPHHKNADDIRIMVGLVGDREGSAVFTFSKEFTCGVIKSLMSIDITAIDELAYSALCEMTNIISGNASSLISAHGAASDISTPQIITDYDETNIDSVFYLDTELGRIAVAFDME